MNTPSSAQIAAQIERVLKRDPSVRVLGIRSPARGSWPERLERGERVFRLAWCESTLAARAALLDAESRENSGIVVLTPLGDAELGDDLVARLAGARLYQIANWQLVRDAFGARQIDPRLARLGWIADLLLELMPSEGYPPVPGEFLDAETAWLHLLDQALGLTMARPDPESLLRWTTKPDSFARISALPEPARQGIFDWLGEESGPAGALIAACIRFGFGIDALPLGLVCGVVFREGGEAFPDLTAAAVRLERYVGSRRVETEAGRRWSEAAAAVLSGLETGVHWLERADALLRDIGGSAHAIASPILLSGFEARLSAFATAVERAIADPSAEAGKELEAVAKEVLAHEQARAAQRGRAERAEMALRLARWLRLPEPGAVAGFLEGARAYSGEGGFVDRARLALHEGDDLAHITDAYAKLAQAVRARREKQSEAFARAFAAWSATPSRDGGVIPVERVLDDVVAPLARIAPVLLAVIDGLAFSVFRELAEDLVRLGWIEIVPAGRVPTAAVAMPPTITDVSRATLLCGRPMRGTAAAEKTGFAERPALVAASRSGLRPLLLHKAELGESGLASNARDAIGSPERRIVGFVYNAIDDHLDGPDQLRPHWTLDDLRLLRPILREARNAGRVLVITADHGHIIEEATAVQRVAGEIAGDRWRPISGLPITSQEICIRGGRVIAPAGEGIILAWSERLRYGVRKNGYHGGAAPQEVLVPLAVFAPTAEIDGWEAAPGAEPVWWDVAPPPPLFTQKGASTSQVRDEYRGLPLFDTAPEARQIAPAVDWIADLLRSEVYSAQKVLAARTVPSDEQIRRLLEALADRGGKLGRAALAQRLGLPIARLSGFLTAARRILNIDQAMVLSLDETSDTIALDLALLEGQFRIGRG